jgi:predicted 3-demethylubiquinone-9 3-methyltransferase (glyoxalase superfamily)
MTKDVTSFLMFTQGGCEEAIRFYVSLFPDSRIDSLVRYPESAAQNSGRVMMAAFTLNGRPFRANDSVGFHEFDFTPSFSIFVECADMEEIEHLYEILGDGGAGFMPLDNYGFSQRFGWVQDRFGISWQLNLA